jgi:transposase
MSKKRKVYKSEFKAKVAVEALKGDQTIPELASRYEVHPAMITRWKKELLEAASDVFADKRHKKSEKDYENETKELHAKIGQLTMERDFLAKACGR